MSPIAPIQNNFNPPLGKPARTSSTSMPSSMQRSSLNRSPISGQISPQQQQQPQQPMRNLQSAHVTPQQQPIRSLQSGHVTNSRMSPQNASQALSPDNSLSISSNSRTGIHSGMKPKPAKRVQSQSPAKIQNEAKVRNDSSAFIIYTNKSSNILYKYFEQGSHMKKGIFGNKSFCSILFP